MMNKLKVFGLALVAICSMIAMIATAAQAIPTFTSASYPATITGEGGEKFGEKLIFNESDHFPVVECNKSSYHGTLSSASTTLTLTPAYTECRGWGFLNATVHTEGCTYVFHATEGSAGVYKSHVDVECPAGKSIKIVGGTCEVEIKTQTGLTTAKSTNSAGTVLVRPEVTGIAYTVVKDGFGCPYTGTGNKAGARWTATSDIVMKGSGGSISVSG
jgi:hypothetical protein